MTLLRLPLAAATVALLGAGSSLATGTPDAPVAPSATAVLVQATAPARAGTPSILPAEVRRLQAAGADVTVVYGPADATAAAIRAAATHGAVLGSGPAVREALTRTALDHPSVRFAPLGSR